MSTFNEFVDITRLNGMELSERQVELFLKLWEAYKRGNKVVGMVSANDLEKIPIRHFFDSITPLFYDLIPQTGRILDIGSGGGLPGLPIAICCPNAKITLVDSNRKKMSYVRHIARGLSLNYVRVLVDRVENLGDDPTESASYAVCMARAVTSIENLVTWSAPLLMPGSHMICFKGPLPEGEIAQAKKILSQCSCAVEKVVYIRDLYPPSNMSLVVIKKIM